MPSALPHPGQMSTQPISGTAGTGGGSRGSVRDVTALASSTSVRTLILGVNPAGRILWHDQNAQQMLCPPGAALLGAPLEDLVVGGAAGTPLSGLLDALRSGREATAVLTLRAQRSDPIDAVVTVQAIDSYDGRSALVILRMPPVSTER